MFKEYETHHALDGKEPEAVVHSLDCESCVFWVGILPDPQLMEFCHNALDSACFALNTDIHRDRRGNAMYNVEQFFRWMLNLRVNRAVLMIGVGGGVWNGTKNTSFSARFFRNIGNYFLQISVRILFIVVIIIQHTLTISIVKS